MNKLILAFILLSISFTDLNAQHFGIKGGVTLSNVISPENNAAEQNVQTGYIAGIFFNIPIIGDVLTLQPEALAVLNENKSVVNETNTSTRTGFIEVPLLVKLTFFKFLYLYGGPKWSYMTDINSTRNEDGRFEFVKSDHMDDNNRSNIGFAFGIGLQSKRFFLDGRITSSRSNLSSARTFRGVALESNEAEEAIVQITAGIFL